MKHLFATLAIFFKSHFFVTFCKYKSNLVSNPVHGILTLTQVLDQFLGLQETHALFLGPLEQEVP